MLSVLQLRRIDQEDYVVRTHVPNTTYLNSFDILSISDFHKDMLGRAKECEDKEAPTVSPPFPLLALNVRMISVQKSTESGVVRFLEVFLCDWSFRLMIEVNGLGFDALQLRNVNRIAML